MSIKNLISLFFVFFSYSAFCQDETQVIELQKNKYTLAELFTELKDQHHIKLAYSSRILKSEESIEFKTSSIKLIDLLTQVCKRYELHYSQSNGQILITPLKSKSRVSLSGYVYDEKNGESLPTATVVILEGKLGCSTNNYGYYAFNLEPGVYTLVVSFVGYKNVQQQIEILDDVTMSFNLIEFSSELGEITVTQDHTTSKTQRIASGMDRITMKDIYKIPAFLGETDVLKGMQFLPGIQGVNDGLSQISVRGGTFDQNLVLLDEAPVYNPTHVLGFFSAFNPDAVTHAEIYKGYIPAKFGGRLSSTIDIRMKEGNRKRFSAAASVNNYAGRLAIETPLFGGNTSLIIAGRYAYPDYTFIAAKELNETLKINELNNFPEETEVKFWDFNAKINHKLNDRNHLYLSAYSGHDYFFYPQFETNSSMTWGNTTGTFRWNHIFNANLFSNTSVIYSNYQYSYLFYDNGYNYDWKAGMQEFNLKTDFTKYTAANHELKYGFSFNNHFFSPGQITPLDTVSSIDAYKLSEKIAMEPSFYMSYKKAWKKWEAEGGLRCNGFISQTQDRDDKLNTYFSLAPRLAAKYNLSSNSSLKASYSRTYQYLHLLKNAVVGLPTDVWLPAGDELNPQSADQLSLGFYQDLFKKRFEFSAETYYKQMNDIIDYLDNADLFLKEDVSGEVGVGDGRSYGVELMLTKNGDRISGNISYTLSQSDKKIEGVNNNQRYPFAHDNRHCFDANMSLELGKRWTFNTAFVYKSGAATTMPLSHYFYENVPFALYSERNAYRLPAYHKLDLSISKKSKLKEGRRWSSEFTIGVNNVYNRENTFAVFMSVAPLYINEQRYYGYLKQLYLFGAMPFINYSFKF